MIFLRKTAFVVTLFEDQRVNYIKQRHQKYVQNIPEHIESIIVSLLSGTASETEADQLRQWIDESPENKVLWKQYRATHHLLQAYSRKERYAPSKAWKKIQPLLEDVQTMPKIRQADFTKWFYRIAAIVVLAFSAGMMAMYYSIKAEKIPVEISETNYTVPYGSKAKVVLPDNSTVWVNAGSVLRYNTDFNQSDRSVYIEGEAYFQVAKNPDKPFYVKTSAITLKVLGTSFNLKAYPDEANIETTVESGTVQMISNIKGQHLGDIVLTAGQKVMIVKEMPSVGTKTGAIQSNTAIPPAVGSNNLPTTGSIQKTIVSKDVDTELYTSWKDKRWLIEKESLESLAIKLERRYNVNITFTDDQLKEYSFSGILEDETLEQVLEAIKLSAPINYKLNHNNVTLSPNKWVNRH